MQPRPPIIVMDLEWTAWDGSRKRCWTGPGEEMEIVQIGAVKLADTPELPEIGAFEVLIKPRINSLLDDYFVALTGISQDRLNRDGMDLKPALADFAEFVHDAVEICGFGDELSHIVWNCQLYGMVNPLARATCHDIRDSIIKLLDAEPDLDSSELPQAMNFKAPGRAHQGLADSRCVAEALRRARAAGKF
tara:strand:+ start:77 stop:649 length:573 start_codon:yes stop_codon:yes gene_type:complete